MMWPTLLLGLLVASVAGWIVTVYFQTQRIRRLERSHEEIQVEETLVFDFLHGLGEAFRETIRSQELHRLIVEGATRVLDAHGGALYVTDRTGGKLTPAFISKGCPPLIEIPQQRIWQWVDHCGCVAVWKSRSGCLGARQWPEGCAVFTGRVRRF